MILITKSITLRLITWLFFSLNISSDAKCKRSGCAQSLRGFRSLKRRSALHYAGASARWERNKKDKAWRASSANESKKNHKHMQNRTEQSRYSFSCAPFESLQFYRLFSFIERMKNEQICLSLSPQFLHHIHKSAAAQ